MTQNEVLAQCAHQIIQEDHYIGTFYGSGYESLVRSVSIDEDATKYRAQVHHELKAQMNQLQA